MSRRNRFNSPKEIIIGMKVAVNDIPDGQLYTVVDVTGFAVQLVCVEKDGQHVDAGIVDYCYLRKPTKEQLQNENNI